MHSSLDREWLNKISFLYNAPEFKESKKKTKKDELKDELKDEFNKIIESI